MFGVKKVEVLSNPWTMAASMFTRLSRLSKGDDYEDLEGDDNVEMDITDMYRSLGKAVGRGTSDQTVGQRRTDSRPSSGVSAGDGKDSPLCYKNV